MVKPTSDHQKQVDDNNVKFKGVRKRKWGKWVSEIRLPNSRDRIWLGSYDSPEKAARAFDAALYCLRGKQAKFNFPDNIPDIAGGTLLKPPEIQIAAAKFANEENPSTSSSSVNLQNSHFEESPMDYPSPMSNSDAGVSYESDLTGMTWPFMDYSALAGSGSSESDFGTFGGLDDFAQNYLAPDLGYDEEMNGGDYSQSSSLWNFYF